jgi:two-component system CheB/CheR fusion protein
MTMAIVGIGASAGGLEAVAELLGALPATTGLAYIVVQHLDPKHESLLPEILAKKTAMPVSAARSGQIVQPDHVYVIPPDVTLTVHGGRISLQQRVSTHEPPLPVDVLFKSLADAYGDSAIGVVLSGGGSDGSSGIRALRMAGGITLAQTPETARFADMPRHAIETGCVDLTMRPSEIAAELVRLAQRFAVGDAAGSGQTTTRGTEADPDEASLTHIVQRIRSAHRVDFTHYKRTTIWRRLHRRLALRRVATIQEYDALLDGDPAELAALYQDLLIRVTDFFRDPESFDALRQSVFPALYNARPSNRPLRIWVPGCATGEEVYSVAMALLEYLGDPAAAVGVQIFGTDISDAALQKARAGLYARTELDAVSPERLERFFTAQNDEFRVAKEVRNLCLFARQDVTRDPPYSRLDLISCRNLLIYLDAVAQRQVLRSFHYALRPAGMVVFGPAESVSESSDLFELVDKRFRVYRRLPNPGGALDLRLATPPHATERVPDVTDAAAAVDAESVLRKADRLLLARFAPASLLINHAFTILQFRGRIGPYLEPAGGVPSFDLRRVVRPELLVQITPVIEETSASGAPSRRDVTLEDGREVSLEIIPLTGALGARSYLILFDDGSRRSSSGDLSATVAALPESAKDRRLVELERQVADLRTYLRAAIEEHGASQEELRSAHEEVLSANEEFQSTNEELHTSKEELQSTNEELTTTIEELRHRNQELADLNEELTIARSAADRARSYADIIIETVRQPLAVLDDGQRILRVNPAFSLDLGVARGDAEGRLLHEMDGGRWNIAGLRQTLHDIVNNNHTMEDYQVTVDLPARGRRVMALSARKIPGDAARAQLLLLAFDDVTVQANVTAGLVANNARKDEFLAMLGHELRHPLTPITHAIYLLRRGNPEPATAQLLETIDTQTRRLQRFVDELLDVARISRGLIEVRRDSVDLVSVVREAARAIEPLIASRQHKLSLVLPPRPVYVSGDAGRLNQVVMNLLENAAKYTDPGGEIRLALERHDNGVTLSVRDNGIGIAPENLEHVFEPFTPVHRAVAGRSSGLGLGLSVVRRVLELHGGRIEATSQGLTRGSEFVAWLPLLAPGRTATLKPPTSMHAPRASVKAPRVRRVLIVDDHDEIRTSLARVVRSFGHEVAMADDGEAALALAETFRPDCAILDIALQGMDGIKLARRLREKFPPDALFLIALTGFGDADRREQCRAAGFDEYLVKPGEIDKLERVLGAGRPVTDEATR